MISSSRSFHKSSSTTAAAWVFLLRLLSIAILCIPLDHVCSFQSMHQSPRARTDKFTRQTIGRSSSSLVAPLKLSSSARSKGSNSTPMKKATNSKPKQSKFDIQWEEKFRLLCIYKEREGHANVPQTYEEEGVQLGKWLRNQRQSLKDGTLKAERQQKLESVGVLFDGVKEKELEDRWEEMFDLLETVQQREGDANILRSHKEGEVNLGLWFADQRRQYRDGTLQEERQQKLESIGVLWDGSAANAKRLNMLWEKTFELLVTVQKREGDANVPTTHVEEGVKLGAWLSKQCYLYRNDMLQAERQEKLESLGVDLAKVDRNKSLAQSAEGDELWEKMFRLLCIYQEREGHCNVPYTYEEEGAKLGKWLQRQRFSYAHFKLKANRKKKLESLGLNWDGNIEYLSDMEVQWEQKLSLLEQFQEREGHCIVPKKHQEGGKNLGMWVYNQRALKKRGTLEATREARLEAIGMVWVATASRRTKLEIQWEQMLNLLEQYQEREGHCIVPKKHQEGGKNLGVWVHNQRAFKKRGTLEATREARLEAVGMVWDVAASRRTKLEIQWEQMLNLLEQYQEREGHCIVPSKHQEGGKNLGVWVHNQRALKKKGSLIATRESRLEAIGMVWDVAAFKIEEMMASLLRYKEREGDCNVPVSHIEDKKHLGQWLHRQRRLKATEKLDSSLSKDLEAAGVVWSVNEEKWESMFALLEQFQKREGHCRVRRNHKEGKDNKNLGAWLDFQRTQRKNGKLDAARETRLENLGVEWKIYAKFDEGEDDDDWGFEGMDHLFDDEDMYD